MSIKIKNIKSESATGRVNDLNKESIKASYALISKLHGQCVETLEMLLTACDSGIAGSQELRALREQYQDVQSLKERHLRTLHGSVEHFVNAAIGDATVRETSTETTPVQEGCCNEAAVPETSEVPPVPTYSCVASGGENLSLSFSKLDSMKQEYGRLTGQIKKEERKLAKLERDVADSQDDDILDEIADIKDNLADLQDLQEELLEEVSEMENPDDEDYDEEEGESDEDDSEEDDE